MPYNRNVFLIICFFWIFPNSIPLLATNTATPVIDSEVSNQSLLPKVPERIEDFSISRELRDRMQTETKLAIDFIQKHHYKQIRFTEIDSKTLLESYLEDLDGSHVFFMKDDIEAILKRFQVSLKPVYLVKGDLYPAFEIFKYYRQRVLERLDWIEKRLQEEFDFTIDETYAPDREESPWPKDKESADKLWEKRLKNELITELVNDESLDKAKERLASRYDRVNRYVKNIEPYEIEETFLNSYASLYDPHTSFMSLETTEDFEIMISNSLMGIGALLSDEDGYCTIRNLIPGGPAEKSGKLYAGDKIIEVAQKNELPVDVVGMKINKIVQLIRGEKGTPVILTVISADGSGKKKVTLIRDEIKLTSQLASASIYEVPVDHETIPVGVITLPSFYGKLEKDDTKASSTSEDVEELLNKLKDYGVGGIILDLRNNGGGLLSEAIKLTGLFIKTGPVVQVRFANGEVKRDWDEDKKIVYSGPLVVLTSRNSASASEIVAGALQSIHRALIVGDSSTHGKGTVQMTWPLDQSLQFNWLIDRQQYGTVKITFQKFYLPNGSSTQEKGVLSDITFPSFNDYLPIGESDLDNALPWDSINPMKIRSEDLDILPVSYVDDELIRRLKEATQKRIDTLPEFALLKKRINHLKRIKDTKNLSLLLKKRKKERLADKALLKELDHEQDKLSQNPYPYKEILLDATIRQNEEQQKKLRKNLLPDGKSRINRYYQKFFYYEIPKSKELRQLDVELFDYERLSEMADVIADHMSKNTGLEISTEQMKAILLHFKNADRGSEFNVERIFSQEIEDLQPNVLESYLPLFYKKLVELDPEILLKKPKLDIRLRESLRIVADWLELRLPKEEVHKIALNYQKSDNKIGNSRLED